MKQLCEAMESSTNIVQREVLELKRNAAQDDKTKRTEKGSNNC